ncbi:hypothetical protein Metme_1346 [Methylomonas methanica MC09]|uniref:Uncharacterized protein n=2 Tax=Methylomonas methanica TaxID=421 RepID=F9ZY39_METMM|nr:hypothetical protein Metme_1346 [Methylomonas methanica MC09]
MARFSTNLFVTTATNSISPHAFSDDEAMAYETGLSSTASVLNTLVLRVARKPKDLLAHIRRIYFCYQNAMREPLYAALLDLLLVLDQKGQILSRRVILGCRPMLDAEQFATLKDISLGTRQVQSNRLSLFNKGVVGKSQLLEVNRSAQVQHDYMGLARDFIEYSQLEEAMTILEQGLEELPGRQDLQALLLELYRSTQSIGRFQNHYKWIIKSGAPILNEWQQLAAFFNGKVS